MSSSIRSLILHGSSPSSTLFRNTPITSSIATATAIRLFSTTLPTTAKHANPNANTSRYLPPNVPAYPYGPNINFEPANWGLYGGATLQSGNKISKGRNKGKTRRTWAPHIKVVKLRSDALDEDIELRVQNRVIRTIQKCGGLDAYLLGEKPARIQELGVFGWKLRWRVMNSPAMVRRLQMERHELGAKYPITFAEFKMQKLQEYKQDIQRFRTELAEYEALDEDDKQLTEPPEWTQELEGKKAWVDSISEKKLAKEIRLEQRKNIRLLKKAQKQALKEQENLAQTETSSSAAPATLTA